MSLSTQLRREFQAVSRHIAEDARFQTRPVIAVDALTFQQILQPIRDIFARDPMYARSAMQLSDQMAEVRQMCQEVQAAQTVTDPLIKKRRSQLLNVLQGLYEAIEEMEEKGSVMAEVDYEDLYAVTDLLDVLQANAVAYKEFMRAPQIAHALSGVHRNLKFAQNRFWVPEEGETHIPVAQEERQAAYV